MSYSDILSFANNRIVNEDLREKFLVNYNKAVEEKDDLGLEKATIITNLLSNLALSDEQIVDFLQGAHFAIEDQGALYSNLKLIGYERISSHYANAKPESDIGIKASKIFEQLLAGTNGTHTWFQIESSAMPDIKDIFNNYEAFTDFLGHAKDYIVYVSGGRQTNIGQYGTSSFTESSPYLIDKSDALGFCFEYGNTSFGLDSLFSNECFIV